MDGTRILSYKEAIREAFDIALDSAPNVVMLGEGINDDGGMFGVTEGFNAKYGEERIFDVKYLQHPADSPQWKKIDELFPNFGNEERNIRFGLCTDGINPYGTLNSTHSAWPVFLVIYYLPP